MPKTDLFDLKKVTALADGVEKVTSAPDEDQSDPNEDTGEGEAGETGDFLSMLENAAVSEKAPLPQVDELTVLKQRATLMGITFSNNISVATLAAKIDERLKKEEQEETDRLALLAQEEEDDVDPDQETVDHDAAVKAAKAAMQQPLQSKDGSVMVPKHLRGKTVQPTTVRQRLILDAKRLIRCRITNLDPKKKDLRGEIITVANGVIGTIKKFVPFGEQTENGYMLENAIFKVLQKKRFLQIRVRMVRGREVVESNYVKEYALEVLPQLTPEELARLATAQLAAGSLDSQQ